MDPNLGASTDSAELSTTGSAGPPARELPGEPLPSPASADGPSRLQALAAALLTTAFGRAFQEYAAGRQTPVDRKRLEAQVAAALQWARTKTPEPSALPVPLAELLQRPEQSACYSALWGAFTQPAVPDRDGRFDEPLIDATSGADRRQFEQLFRRTLNELLAAPAGHELCQGLLAACAESERAMWIERVLLCDQSSWGKRHVLPNLDGSAVLPHLPLATMYVEPDAVWQGSPHKKPAPVGVAVRAALAAHPLVVVSAESGSGKSLTARILAWQLARQRLCAREVAADAQEVPVPIVIPGRVAASAPFELRRAAARARWQTLVELGLGGLRDSDPALLPTGTRTLYLIDSGDELALAEHGATDFFAQLRSQLPAGHRAVVFCRPRALSVAAAHRWQVPVLELLPFSISGESLGQVGQWLQRWNSCSGRPPLERAALTAEGQLLELAQNPMLLFLLAYTFPDRAALYPDWKSLAASEPEESRWDLCHLLYEAFFRALISGRYDPKRDESPPLIDADAGKRLYAALLDRGLTTPAAGPLARPQKDGEHEKATASMLWLLSRMAWEARCLEQEERPKALTSWRIAELLGNELELDDARTLEAIRDGLLRALRTDSAAVERATLLAHPSFREFLVGRCWGALLGVLLDPGCSEERRHALTLVLRRGRLLTGADRSFDFLRARLRQWDEAAQLRLSRWAEHEFRDERLEDTPATVRGDRRRDFRKTALALACAFARADGLRLGDATGLRALLASFWTVGQRARLFLPRLQAAGARLGKAPLHAAYLQRADLRAADLQDALLEDAHLACANLAGANLAGANLRGANLEGANLTHANLEQANLSGACLLGAQLQGARLLGADLSRARLAGAQLQGAQLVRVNLEGAQLVEAQLSEAQLGGANLSRARLTRANLARAALEAAQLEAAELGRANLEGADLSRTNLEGANLMEAQLVGATLLRANLGRANLEGACLAEAHMSRANLEDAQLGRANLTRANLESAHLGEAQLGRANLEGADLSHANLEGANLDAANLVGAHLLRSNLARANLTAAHLEGAHLLGANLAGAQLLSAHLEGAHLEGAHLLGAHIQDAYLQGAHLGRANLGGVDLRQAHLDDSGAALAEELGALVAAPADCPVDCAAAHDTLKTRVELPIPLPAEPAASPPLAAGSAISDLVIEVVESCEDTA